MPRNVERDAREAERRRKQLLEAGFELFAEKGIDNVSLQSVADYADVGVATMYKYYVNKVNLVVAISAYVWKNVWNEYIEKTGMDVIEGQNAYDILRGYINLIIDVYNNRPEILKFSGNYKTYINRESVPEKQVAVHLDSLKQITDLFHIAYEHAKVDGSIRTDISEEELFMTVTLTMLGMAERFAEGVVWADDKNKDKSKELNYLKEMLLDWCTKK